MIVSHIILCYIGPILIVLITLHIFCHIQIKNHDNCCLCNLFSILVRVVKCVRGIYVSMHHCGFRAIAAYKVVVMGGRWRQYACCNCDYLFIN